MSAIIRIQPLDSRGEEILDLVERETGEDSRRAKDGTREYALLGPAIAVATLEEILDRIAPDWRDHLAAN